MLLPMLVQWLYELLKRYLFLLPLLMFGYAIFSSINKVGRTKVISEKYRLPLGEINTIDDYKLFQAEAAKSDLIYVIHADLKYDLPHCKTIYNQDDFIALKVIQERPKASLTNKTVVFLLPERFATNGKRDAILANFISANPEQPAQRTIRKLSNWELITVRY